MTTGVTGGSTGSLVIVKTGSGIQVQGTPPQSHAFPVKFLDRELNDGVRIHVVVPCDPPVVYEISNVNEREWSGHLIASPPIPTPEKKRRWWRRGG